MDDFVDPAPGERPAIEGEKDVAGAILGPDLQVSSQFPGSTLFVPVDQLATWFSRYDEVAVLQMEAIHGQVAELGCPAARIVKQGQDGTVSLLLNGPVRMRLVDDLPDLVCLPGGGEFLRCRGWRIAGQGIFRDGPYSSQNAEHGLDALAVVSYRGRRQLPSGFGEGMPFPPRAFFEAGGEVDHHQRRNLMDGDIPDDFQEVSRGQVEPVDGPRSVSQALGDVPVLTQGPAHRLVRVPVWNMLRQIFTQGLGIR